MPELTSRGTGRGLDAGRLPVGKVDVGIPVVTAQQVNAISATMHATTTDGKPFTRLPTSCATATSSVSVETNEAGTGAGSDTFVPTAARRWATPPRCPPSR